MPDPIVEQITQNIETTLQGVTKANGDNFDLIVERRKRDGNSTDHGAAVIYQDDPELLPTEETPIGWIGWIQPYQIELHIRESEEDPRPPDQLINLIRSDVEKKLMEDPHRGNLAIDTHPDDPDLFEASNGSYEGIIVNIRVPYRTLENDPYSQ